MAVNKNLVDKIEQLSKLIHLLIVKLTVAAATLSPPLIAIIKYFILDMGDESFRFDGTEWFPFDPNTPCGFLVAVLFQNVSIFVLCYSYTPIICVFIGSCLSIVTFQKDVATDISHFKRRKIANSNEQQLTERFCNFVRFHADVEELSSGIFRDTVKNIIVMNP